MAVSAPEGLAWVLAVGVEARGGESAEVRKPPPASDCLHSGRRRVRLNQLLANVLESQLLEVLHRCNAEVTLKRFLGCPDAQVRRFAMSETLTGSAACS